MIRFSLKRCLYIAVVFLLGCKGSISNANESLDIPFRECFDKASSKYNIHPALLAAIAKVESNFNPKAVNSANSNGSTDFGLMQINSRWLKSLGEHGITKNDLLSKPCVNVDVGAWILANNFHGSGITWDSVGAYNAGFSDNRAAIRQRYAENVFSHYTVYRDVIKRK